MIEKLLYELSFLVKGTIPAVISKVLYIILLLIFFISIISWTYRRALCVFDAGWASYSIRNLFRLVFCLVFFLLCSFSISSMFYTKGSYIANPYMVFVISVNVLYVVTTLGSCYITEYKKPRIIVNALLFSSWCISIVSLYLLSIRPTTLYNMALHEKTIWSFGLRIYKKLNPFFLGKTTNTFYEVFFTIYLNVYNFICVGSLIIFTKLIPSIKNKLISFKYIILLNLMVLLRDILFYSLRYTQLANNLIAIKIIGTIITIILLLSTVCFILFIHSEGRYDQNLKKKRLKIIKQDTIEIVKDFTNARNDAELNTCKKRLNALLRRIEILNIKVDITKYAKFDNPCIESIFLGIIQERKI